MRSPYTQCDVPISEQAMALANTERLATDQRDFVHILLQVDSLIPRYPTKIRFR